MNDASCITNKTFILVPFWVQDAVERNKMSMSDVLDYGKMRAIMSLEDLASFLSIQKADKLNLFKASYNPELLDNWKSTVQDGQREELDSTVIPLSYKPEIVQSSYERLQPVEGQTVDCTWQLKDFSRNTFAVVMYPGFEQNIKLKDSALALMRKILEIFYGYYEVHRVSQLPLFGEYLKLLQVSNI